MLIPSANPLLPAATPDSPVLPGALPAADGSGKVFGDSLLAQLGVLQSGLSGAATAGVLQRLAATPELPSHSEGLQSLAAGMGQSLPAANEFSLLALHGNAGADFAISTLDVDQSLLGLSVQSGTNSATSTKNVAALQPLAKNGIKLDDTRSALADVQRSIQAGVTGSSETGLNVDLDTRTLDVDQSLLGLSVKSDTNSFGATKTAVSLKHVAKNDINLDDTLRTLADVLSFIQDVQPAANGESTQFQQLHADDSRDSATARDDANKADLQASLNSLVALAQQPLALSTSTPVSTQQAMMSSTVGEQLNGDAFKQNTIASAFKVKQQPASTIAALNADKLGAAADEGSGFSSQLSALLSLSGVDNASKQGLETGAVIEDVMSQVSTSLPASIEKNTFSMQADIAQLNQVVGGDTSKVEVPAMTRPLAHPQWDAELADKLVWMHKQAVPAAEMRLNPEHLGPISIRVDVDQNDEATVSFTAQHAVVKETIEAAIPKLREMLGEQQLKLVDVNVSQQQSEQRQSSAFFQMASDQGKHPRHAAEEDVDNVGIKGEVDVLDEVQSGRAVATNGLLSLFA